MFLSTWKKALLIPATIRCKKIGPVLPLATLAVVPSSKSKRTHLNVPLSQIAPNKVWALDLLLVLRPLRKRMEKRVLVSPWGKALNLGLKHFTNSLEVNSYKKVCYRYESR